VCARIAIGIAIAICVAIHLKSELELESNEMAIRSPSSDIFEDTLNGSDGVDGILTGLAIELVEELMDRKCVVVVVVVTGVMDLYVDYIR
jgi:hypothetical protein